MSRRILLTLALALLAGAGLSRPVAAQSPEPALLHLRRGAFDPLEKAATEAAAPLADTASDLLLVQLDAPPDEATPALLAAAGLRPLWYIPDNAFLVRATDAPRARSLAGLRWVGPFASINKLSPDLDAQLAAPDDAPLALRLVVAPDADAETVARDITSLGAQVLTRSDGLNGALLRIVASGSALPALAARGDVLWIEPYLPATVLDDRARAIIGVPAAAGALGLTGAGQIVAVTDTGLDVQDDLSADFAGQVARGYSRQEMFAPCATLGDDRQPGTWSDLHGHGTHVAGMVAGSGVLSGGQFAGVAPGARLVVQSVSSGGDQLDCLPDAATYLQLGYDAGARIHNGSFGRRTGSGSCEYGCYTSEDADVDDFLWRHKDYLFVVAAGNAGRDISAPYGVIDPDSLTSPATAKNVLTVGASENDRPGAPGCSSLVPERACWSAFDPTNASGFRRAPFETDQISDNSAGIAAFSGRGPTDDGRIKPEIVAPGTNVISARTHYEGVRYGTISDDNDDYVYLSGTSMATPQVSGAAALVRQWLVQQRGVTAPGAALVKALLLNGATSVRPGQYPAGDEIPGAWPNTVEGWGRAAVADAVGVGADRGVWFKEHGGLSTGVVAEYPLTVQAGEPLRVTLAWTDYPAAAGAGKALVNDLDLQVVGPDGAVLAGNVAASLPGACRVGGADRCNTVESLEIAAPVAGSYTVRVRGAAVPRGPQPFAVAVRAGGVTDLALAAPLLRPVAGAGPSLALRWTPVAGATYYRIEVSSSASFSGSVETLVSATTSLTVIETLGTHYVRVRGCAASGCGDASNVERATVTVPPKQVYLPALSR